MKKILILLTILPAVALAQSNIIYGYVGDSRLVAQRKVKVVVTPISPDNRTSGLWDVQRIPLFTYTATNGYYDFTNLLWGQYRRDIEGTPGTQFTFYVGTNTLGTVPITSLTTNQDAQPPNPATLYYSMAQVDALIAGAVAQTPAGTVTNGQSGVAFKSSAGAFALSLSNAAAPPYMFEILNGTGMRTAELDADGSGYFGTNSGVFWNSAGDLTARTFTGNGSGLTHVNTDLTNSTGQFDPTHNVGILLAEKVYADVSGNIYEAATDTLSIATANRRLVGAWTITNAAGLPASALASGVIGVERLASTNGAPAGSVLTLSGASLVWSNVLDGFSLTNCTLYGSVTNYGNIVVTNSYGRIELGTANGGGSLSSPSIKFNNGAEIGATGSGLRLVGGSQYLMLNIAYWGTTAASTYSSSGGIVTNAATNSIVFATPTVGVTNNLSVGNVATAVNYFDAPLFRFSSGGTVIARNYTPAGAASSRAMSFGEYNNPGLTNFFFGYALDSDLKRSSNVLFNITQGAPPTLAVVNGTNGPASLSVAGNLALGASGSITASSGNVTFPGSVVYPYSSIYFGSVVASKRFYGPNNNGFFGFGNVFRADETNGDTVISGTLSASNNISSVNGTVSAGLGFTQPGVFNVMSYGATNSQMAGGVATAINPETNTLAFQLAIDAAQNYALTNGGGTNGAIVYVPAGHYYLGTNVLKTNTIEGHVCALYFRARNVQFIGDGWQSTILELSTNASVNTVRVTGAGFNFIGSHQLENCRIAGLTFDGRSDWHYMNNPTGAYPVEGLHLYGTTNTVIENCYIRNFSYDAIDIHAADPVSIPVSIVNYQNYILNCQFMNWGDNGIGINTPITVRGCTFYASATNGPQAAIKNTTYGSVKISGNTFFCDYGINSVGSSDLIENNFFYNWTNTLPDIQLNESWGGGQIINNQFESKVNITTGVGATVPFVRCLTTNFQTAAIQNPLKIRNNSFLGGGVLVRSTSAERIDISDNRFTAPGDTMDAVRVIGTNHLGLRISRNHIAGTRYGICVGGRGDYGASATNLFSGALIDDNYLSGSCAYINCRGTNNIFSGNTQTLRTDGAIDWSLLGYDTSIGWQMLNNKLVGTWYVCSPGMRIDGNTFGTLTDDGNFAGLFIANNQWTTLSLNAFNTAHAVFFNNSSAPATGSPVTLGTNGVTVGIIRMPGTTNAAPSGVTVGTTAPDGWEVRVIGGVNYYCPVWITH